MSQTPDYLSATILVVDDDPGELRVVENILARAGYVAVFTASSAPELVERYRRTGADLLLVDLHVETCDGAEILRRLHDEVPEPSYVPILFINGGMTRDARMHALAAGATDFIPKPLEPEEVLLRVRNHLHTRHLHLALAEQIRELERNVDERTREMEEASGEVLERLGGAADLHDDETGSHTRRVGELSARIAAAMGLPAAEVEMIRRTAPLHDIGKIGIPDPVLLKAGRLTEAEWELMKSHTTIGAKILSRGRSDMIRMAERIALSHHERWDGSGYPEGLKGERIPLCARIVAVADVFDALTSARTYRGAWAKADVLAEIRRERGIHFDPDVVDAFLSQH